MQCLKCGNETEENQVFCRHCLEVMEKYPVKCTAPVHLPDRKLDAPPKKISRKKWLYSPEEQISHLKTTRRRLIITVVVLSLLIVLGAGVLGKILYSVHLQHLAGKNYAVETTPTTAATSVPAASAPAPVRPTVPPAARPTAQPAVRPAVRPAGR